MLLESGQKGKNRRKERRCERRPKSSVISWTTFTAKKGAPTHYEPLMLLGKPALGQYAVMVRHLAVIPSRDTLSLYSEQPKR